MQQEILVIDRFREMLIRQRTQLINAIRGHLAEFGVIGPNRAHNIGLLPVLSEDETDAYSACGPACAGYLVEQLIVVKNKLARIDSDLVCGERLQRLPTIDDDTPGSALLPQAPWCRPRVVRLTSNPADIFPLGSGWCPSSIPRAERSNSARSASEGMATLRKLLIHGGRSIMRWRGRAWIWLAKLTDRRPADIAAVETANKTARIVWALLRYGGTYGAPTRNAT